MDDFLNIQLDYTNLDRYIIRTAILDALNANLIHLSGNLIDIGCGKMPYKNHILENSKVAHYTGLDIESALTYDETIKPDYQWGGEVMPFESNRFDCALATEVLEHCPEPDRILTETCRILKPGGSFFFTVPFLWNLHEVPNDHYRFTPFSLDKHLHRSGFENIKLKATGGWHASMAQMLGLWVKRGPIAPRKQQLIGFFALPIMRYLLKKDKITNGVFSEGDMITGISGIAYKK